MNTYQTYQCVVADDDLLVVMIDTKHEVLIEVNEESVMLNKAGVTALHAQLGKWLETAEDKESTNDEC